MSGIDRNAWAKALQEARAIEPPPSRAITTFEFAELLGYSRTQAAKLLKRLVAAKKARVTKKIIRCADGALRVVPAYELAEEMSGKS